MKVELFPFQQKAVKNLRMFAAISKATYPVTSVSQVTSFTAPTGAGKTIMIAAFVESVYSSDENYPAQPDAIFVWLSDSPELNQQSKNKFAEKTNSQKKFVEGHSFTEEEWQKFLNSGSGTDPKKAAAFSRLEELRKNNSVHFSPDTDWKKEIAEAACEKYGYFN